MRTSTRGIVTVGLLAELLLALFPPMRANIAAEPNSLVLGRTEHYLIFTRIGGAWSIDVGRFLVYVLLIAWAVALVALLDAWWRTSRHQAP